ncbi:MAG: hypothetical protein WBA12_01135 [Catalinimonas sp.]
MRIALFLCFCLGAFAPRAQERTSDRFWAAGLGLGVQLPPGGPGLFTRSLEGGYGWEFSPTTYLLAQVALERATGGDGRSEAGLRFARANNLRVGASLGINARRLASQTLFEAEDHRVLAYAVVYAGVVYSSVNAQPTNSAAGGTFTRVYPEFGPGGGVNIGLNKRQEVYVLLYYLVGLTGDPTGYGAADATPITHRFRLSATFRGLIGDAVNRDKRNWNRLRYRKKWEDFRGT